MAQTADGYDSLIKWNSEGESGVDTGLTSEDAPLEMSVENINAAGIVGNDQAYAFMSNASDLQQSLGSGIFAAESLTDDASAEHRNGEMLPAETSDRNFENITEPSDSGVSKDKGLSGNAAELSVNSSVEQVDPSPLGSSQNPIRIIQQGNKYTSMQELSTEQLNQIMQV